MLQLRTGEAMAESAIRTRLGPAPITLATAARVGLGTHRWLGIDNPASHAHLRAFLRVRWCAVTVCGGPVTAWANAANLISPHGVLATVTPPITALERQARPHHAIVLIELARGRITYLDPWFPAAGQPLSADLESFVKWAWVGDAFLLE